MQRKIKVSSAQKRSIESCYEEFLSACSARGLSEKTISTYRSHLRCISKHLDITMPLAELSRSNVDAMISSMRLVGLANNSISSYVRAFKAFLSWANGANYTTLSIPSFRQKETVKETYSDEELKLLLARPDKNSSFCELRNWIIVQFLLNCGCRSSTIRNIQNRDVDLLHNQVVFRHTKTGKLQSIPLCSTLERNLRGYMNVRMGEPTDYLFCDEYGQMLSENALKYAIRRYNQSRSVSKTSLHMFRHTFARKYLMDCGGNAFELQKLLGHSTLEMTKHYCTIFNSDLSRDYDKRSPLEQMAALRRIKK